MPYNIEMELLTKQILGGIGGAVCIILVFILCYFLIIEPKRKAANAAREAAREAAEAEIKPAVDPFAARSQLSTLWDDEGDGRGLYLDRHNINCETNALNQIRLQRDNGKMSMKYTCASSGELGTPETQSTPLDTSDNGNVYTLDKHNADCGPSSVMTQLHLGTTDDGNWQWKYSCAPSKTPLKCRSTSTQLNNGGTGQSWYLDRHDIKCDTNEAISQMHLVKGNTNNYEIQYTCCQV